MITRSGKDVCASGEREFQRCSVRKGGVDGSPVEGAGPGGGVDGERGPKE